MLAGTAVTLVDPASRWLRRDVCSRKKNCSHETGDKGKVKNFVVHCGLIKNFASRQKFQIVRGARNVFRGVSELNWCPCLWRDGQTRAHALLPEAL